MADRLEELAELDESAMGWWSISGVAILEALHRVARGDDPDVVYTELYVNSDHESPEGS